MLYKSQVQSGIKSHNNIRGDNNSLKQPLCKIVLRYIRMYSEQTLKLARTMFGKTSSLCPEKNAAFFIITNTCPLWYPSFKARSNAELFMSRPLYIELSTWKLWLLFQFGTARPFFSPSWAVFFSGETAKVGGRVPWPLVSQKREKKDHLIAG